MKNDISFYHVLSPRKMGVKVAASTGDKAAKQVTMYRPPNMKSTFEESSLNFVGEITGILLGCACCVCQSLLVYA